MPFPHPPPAAAGRRIPKRKVLVVERCPICHCDRTIVFAGSERRTFLCSDCGAKWMRDGTGAKNIVVGHVSPDHPAVVAKAPRKGDVPRRSG